MNKENRQKKIISLNLDSEVWQKTLSSMDQTMEVTGMSEGDIHELVQVTLRRSREFNISRKLLFQSGIDGGFAHDDCPGMSGRERGFWYWGNYDPQAILSGNFNSSCRRPSTSYVTFFNKLIRENKFDPVTGEFNLKKMKADMVSQVRMALKL